MEYQIAEVANSYEMAKKKHVKQDTFPQLKTILKRLIAKLVLTCLITSTGGPPPPMINFAIIFSLSCRRQPQKGLIFDRPRVYYQSDLPANTISFTTE